MSLLQLGLRRAARVGMLGWCLAALGCSFDSRPDIIASAEAAVSEDEDAGDDSDAGLQDAVDATAPAADGDSGDKPDAGTDRPSGAATVTTPSGTMTMERPRDAGQPMDSSAPQTQDPIDAGADAARDVEDAGKPSTVNPNCREGDYDGTFNGSLQLLGVSASTLSGTVRGELEMNPAGTYLELRDAPVMGVDQSGNTLSAKLSANINCMNHELTNGELRDGVFHNVAANTDTAFSGMVEGMYTEDPASVTGTWMVRANDFPVLLSGRGGWNLTLRD
jgi:hypothetical protein